MRESVTSLSISISDIGFGYNAQSRVLDALSLEIAAGEIVALLGPSGCGKSTLLRIIAQLLKPDKGEIRFSGGSLDRRRGEISFVFQDPTLLPWRTVKENVRLPLELGATDNFRLASKFAAPFDEKRADPQAEAMVLETSQAGDLYAGTPGCRAAGADVHRLISGVLESVGLGVSVLGQYPRELSGGMRMRASIARALVTDPKVMLLDEPFAALDDLLRTRMNDLLLDLWHERERTILFVTHNIAEAVYLSHRIVLLGGGRIAKIIDNTLPWPRSAPDRSSTRFAELYGAVSAGIAEVAPHA